ncbi:MAG: hypothetical protein IKN73_02185 [Alphaproteobacteria bacterium]|nr:hypothetical protein [Alphaproteobacteria bacterium]
MEILLLRPGNKTAGRANGARAAKMSGQKNAGVAGKSTGAGKTSGVGVKATAGNSAKPSAGKPNGARAAATQKVVQAGTKVSAKTENTTVSEECKDAFFGCMDSLCMVDNASGGRCMCSDKINDYNKIQEEILKLDEQSYIMATEGVERLKMGENADEILARAKAAGDAAANKKIAAEESAKKSRTLDLSIFNNNALFDEDEENPFEIDTDATQALQDKTGDALYKVSIQMCAPMVPAQCKQSASMLQMMYAQKIKSDCTAYENSLKQQKNASTQKLQTAQKALRDTALEEFQNENKYDLGQCTLRFTECMQTTAGCQEDFTGCVTLAAAENVKVSAQAKGDKQKNKQAKQTTIKGAVSSITLAAATIDQITAKKPLCESVLKQCKKVQDKVWDTFLANIAPTLKSAELIAEDNLRSNCISDVSECFQKACKEYMDPKNPDGSYDMCLSDPMLVVDLCKVKLEPCINATGGTLGDEKSIKNSRLWAGITARLSAMRVDACTSEIKNCLMSDDVCGKDYSKCVGLDTNSIGELCPTDKLTACKEKNGKDQTPDDIRKYIAEVAQGIALNIDNNMLTICQKAADNAMIKVCGSAEECPSLTFNDQIFKDNLNVQVCMFGKENTTDINENYICSNTADGFNAQYVLEGHVIPTVTGMFDLSGINFSDNEHKFESKLTDNETLSSDGDNRYYKSTNWLDTVVNQLNTSLDSKFNAIKSDPTVVYCMEGRKVQGFDGEKFGKEGADVARFPNLLDNKKDIMISSLFDDMRTSYSKALGSLDEKFDKAQKTINDRLARIDGAGEAAQDEVNSASCSARAVTGDFGRYAKFATSVEPKYDTQTNICNLETIQWRCPYYISPRCRRQWEKAGSVTTQLQLHKYNREDALTGGFKSGASVSESDKIKLEAQHQYALEHR